MWLGRSWGGMVKSQGLNFSQPPHFTFTLSTNHLAAIMVPNLSAAFTNHFHFSTNHLAANIILHRPTTVCHPGISPPTRPPSTERPLRVGISPHQTLPSLVLIILGTVWLPLWLGGGSARCRFAWRSFHFRAVVDFTFLVSKLSKKIVQITL